MSERQIVVLDGHALNPGDLSWEPFEALGSLTVHARSAPETVVQRARGHQLVLTNKALVDRAAFDGLPELRYVGVLATGTNVVDLEAARRRGVVVTNVPGYGTQAVAQHVFALLLELTNHTSAHDRAAQAGEWQHCPDFCFTVAPIHELDGKALGIVGLGAIGQAVARIGAAFGMRVLAAQGQRTEPQIDVPVEWLPLDDIFRHSDVVSLHCPLTPATERLVNFERLALMRPDAYLINTSRGPLIDEEALCAALERGHLAGVGLDVLSQEPPVTGNPLLGAPRCIVTPHVAWASVSARQRLMQTAADNLRCFLDGNPQNVVTT